jgi:hypothetical protein
MLKYYFHIREGGHVTVDEEGMTLPGIEAALREAETSGREMLAEMIRDGTPLDGQAVEITSEDGKVLRQVRLKSLFWISA